MEPYYLGGYYLIKPKPAKFGLGNSKIVHTCSGCINISVFDYWCFSWAHDNLTEDNRIEIGLTKDRIDRIRKWTDERFDEGIIKLGNAFADLKTAIAFRDLFFPELLNNIYAIYLPKTDANRLIEAFGIESKNHGAFELQHNLMKEHKERQSTTEEFLGYDCIGVESDGSFHSFYCHGIFNELVDRFSLRLTQYGLFEKVLAPQAIREYLNNDAPVEPVPWYIAKTKRLKHI